MKLQIRAPVIFGTGRAHSFRPVHASSIQTQWARPKALLQSFTQTNRDEIFRFC